MTREPAERRCNGNTYLFDSTNNTDHERAREFCDECPAFDWCHQLARDTQRAYPGGLEGTWAGSLYRDGRLITGNASVGNCPACGATDGRQCQSKNGKPASTPHLARVTGDQTCRICSATFRPTRRHLRYCSEPCATEGVRRKHRRYDANRTVA